MEIPVLKSLSRRRRKLVYWLLGLFLFYTIVGFFILPPIIRSIAVKQLTKQFDREVSIQKVKLNPFTFSVTVRGLLIKDKDGEPFVSSDEVYVNFQLSSLFGKAWTFREISATKPFVRAQINKDQTFNFSDLIAKFSAPATNAATAKPSAPSVLHVGKLRIAGASASFTDLTPRQPFKRVIGPLDVTLQDFRTDSGHKNSYSFAGATDAGDQFAGKGFFQLNPVRSQGDFGFSNIVLNTFAPLYQDILRFNIKSGIAELHMTYAIELSETNRVASVTNASFTLRSLKVSEPGSEMNLIEQPDYSMSGISVDLVGHHAEINSIVSSGARVYVKRGKDATVNVIELAKPTDVTTNAPGGIVFLLHSVTNVVATLLNSTNQWTGIIHEASSRNGALTFEDFFNSRPVRLDLDQLTLVVKNISNLSGTNFTADFSVRWNTNGTIKTTASASFQPFTADIKLALENLDLHPVDPYLQSAINLIIIDSKLGMNGDAHLRTPPDGLPQVTFQGEAWLDDFSTVDVVLGEDLLKWKSLRVSGIDANVNAPFVAIKEISLTDAYARLIIETNHVLNLLAALHGDVTNAIEETNATVKPLPTSATKTAREIALADTYIRAARDNKPVDSHDVEKAENIMLSALSNAEPAMKLSIASIVISNAQARFTDRSFAPSVNMSFEQLNGTIAGLSSDDLQHGDVNLNGQVDGVGPVEITGTINPLIKNQTTDINIKVRNVDLTPTSPYVGKYVGYGLAKGKFEADLNYKIADRKIKATNIITLNQFTFGGKVDSPDAIHLPVRLAVAILKDRDGKIVLNVPVEGNMDDPQFHFGKVIWRAIDNILVKVVTLPFAALGSIFGGKGEEISYQDFLPGNPELQSVAKEKLDALVKGLYERPGLELAIEGSINPVTDRDGLKLLKLDKQLRTRKWTSLRKSEQATATAEQITLTPDERTRFVRELYRDALTRGEMVLITQTTNQAGAVTTTAPLRPGEIEKGGTLLKRGYNQITGSFAAGAAPANLSPGATSSNTKPPGVADVMEQALLANISIKDSDFETLAADRAKAVRAYVLQTGKVEAERIFLTDIQLGRVKTEGSRVYLQLQ